MSEHPPNAHPERSPTGAPADAQGSEQAGEPVDAQRKAALQRAASFAQMDFLEFIRQRDMLRQVDLHKLMAVPVFYDAATDFWNGLVSLGAASSRIRAAMIKAESESIMPGTPHASASRRASRAVPLAGYCSMLQEGDPRRVTLGPRQPSEDILQKYIDPATGERYLDRGPEDVSYCQSTGKRDRQEYIVHWSRAFPDSFERLIEDKRILSRIASAPHYGVDYVTEMLGLAATELPDELPCIDDRLKVELVPYISLLRSQGLLVYHFDPKREFPNYFSEPPVRSTQSSQ